MMEKVYIAPRHDGRLGKTTQSNLVDLVHMINTVEMRAKAWEGSNIIKEMKARVKGIFGLLLMYDLLDMEFSCDIPFHSWAI